MDGIRLFYYPVSLLLLSSSFSLHMLSTCPHCTLQFRYRGAFRNHMRIKHLGLASTFHLTDEEESGDNEIRLETAFLRLDEDTDYESCSDHDEEVEVEEVATHDVRSFPRAGEPIGDVEMQIYDEMRPWAPFNSEKDFILARWFIKSGTPKDRINEFFADGLGGDSSFTSSHTMMKVVDRMENGLGWSTWKSGEVDFVEVEDGSGEGRDEKGCAFFYRNIVACAAYLLAQPCYIDDIVYAPVREINGEGDMMYSEMNTADWWWEQQVGEVNLILWLK